ncbi:MAG: NfeD family protein [Clostridia bacterium]
MEQYIISLFQNMSLLTIVLLSAGMLLTIAEVFMPKIGVTGILGISLLAFGISSYYIDGFKLKQIITIVSIIALILAVFIIIEVVLENKGIIKNPNRYQFRTYYSTNDLNELVGKTGKALTNIDLGGTIDIDGQLYYATSTSTIEKDSFVEVVGVQNNTLIVVKK